MYIDASAILAILNREEDAAHFKAAIDNARPGIITSAVTVFEASLGLARAKAEMARRKPTPDEVRAGGAIVRAFLDANDITEISIEPDIGRAAIEAAALYGKTVGHHPADLNFGDCFVYACAKAHKAPLLFKGEDFAKTDVNERSG